MGADGKKISYTQPVGSAAWAARWQEEITNIAKT